jgi:hypothetical protein
MAGDAQCQRVARKSDIMVDPTGTLHGHASFFDFAGKRPCAATEGVRAFVDREV